MTTQRGSIETFEFAVGVVRVVLAALTAVALSTAGFADTTAGSGLPLAAAAAALSTALALSLAGLAGVRLRLLHSMWFTAILQLIDTSAAVGLMYILADRTPEAAWVLLVVPVVVAAIRLNGLGVLVTWLLGSLGYVLCATTQPERFTVSGQVLIEQLAMLLAVAACIALLTRWLEEGWRAQAELTTEAERAGRRLGLVSAAARSVRDAPSAEVMRRALAHVLELGFDAATYSVAGAVVESSGQAHRLPKGAHLTSPAEPGAVEITRWNGADGRVLHSAALTERLTGNLITGWSEAPIDEATALALADLTAHASQALEAARHLEAARLQATRDPLTGLANRAELQQSLDLVPDGSDRKVAIIFIDLDRFKAVNDDHGHLVGDRLLVEIGRRLRRLVGVYALAVRYGGDEFVVLAAGPAASAASNLAQEIRQTLARPHDLDGLEVTCTASIGVASTSTSAVDQLVRQADLAAYQAKRSGGNSVWVCRGDESFAPVRGGPENPSPRGGYSQAGTRSIPGT